MLTLVALLMLNADADVAVAVSSLPAPVRAALTKNWPDARASKAEREPGGKFEVELTSSKGSFEVTLSASGEILGEERVVTLAATPTPVQKTIASWVGWTVKEIEQVTEGKVVTFEVLAVQGKGGPVEIVLAADGTELKRAPATDTDTDTD